MTDECFWIQLKLYIPIHEIHAVCVKKGLCFLMISWRSTVLLPPLTIHKYSYLCAKHFHGARTASAAVHRCYRRGVLLRKLRRWFCPFFSGSCRSFLSHDHTTHAGFRGFPRFCMCLGNPCSFMNLCMLITSFYTHFVPACMISSDSYLSRKPMKIFRSCALCPLTDKADDVCDHLSEFSRSYCKGSMEDYIWPKWGTLRLYRAISNWSACILHRAAD